MGTRGRAKDACCSTSNIYLFFVFLFFTKSSETRSVVHFLCAKTRFSLRIFAKRF
jgi:hypothetical protein